MGLHISTGLLQVSKMAKKVELNAADDDDDDDDNEYKAAFYDEENGCIYEGG
jgi:hypothetical protein